MPSEPLKRDVYTISPRKAKLFNDKLLKISLLHYGLAESRSCFFEAYHPIFTDTLSMKSAAFDPHFFFHARDNFLDGVTGLVAEDSINNGNARYQREQKDATKKFVTQTKHSFPIRFLSCIINHVTNTLIVGQKEHISRLQLTNTNTLNRDFFRTVRGQLLLIAQNSRPDIFYSVPQLFQIPYEQISLQECQSINSIVTYLKSTPKLKLQCRPLHDSSSKLYVFTDSGYNSNPEMTSQLGILISLVDKFSNFHILHWASAKCQRITRSMLSGELYSFSLG